MTNTLLLAFAPLHKRAFGVAVGLTFGLVVFLLTAIVVLRAGEPAPDIGLLAQYFAGYDVSWRGAVIGAFWAGLAGFTAGWFLALCRNLFVGITLFLVRARSEIDQTRDFLDHI